MTTRGFILISLLLADFLGPGFSAHPQQPTKIPLIGFLANTGPQDGTIEPFRQALRDLGYNEGKNIRVEYRYYEAKRERIPDLVAELVRLNANVLIAGAPPVIRAAKQQTKTIPIVMVTNQDPVAAGYVDSLARPGGNITGLTNLTRDLSEKRLELLTEMVPSISRVGLIWNADGLELVSAMLSNGMRRPRAL